jgi:small neutral amino acid transporter SnatA (MarC family)
VSFAQAFTFFFALLNPFLLSLYLLELIVRLDTGVFVQVLLRGVLIGGVVFSLFALTGDAVFSRLLHVDFSSFQIFGGIVFLLVGIRFFFHGPDAIGILRGAPEHLAGSIAMPFLVGPATVSAAVMIGSSLPTWSALTVVWLTMAGVVGGLAALKLAHDRLRAHHARLVDRYVEITGRVSALMIGTFAVQMIVTGLRSHWPGA